MKRDRKLNLRIKFRKDVFVWIILVAVVSAMATGGIEQEQVVGEGQRPADAAGNPTDGLIQSLSFKKDVSVRDALRFLAAKYQRNIVPSSKVDGLITVTTLYGVTFTEALEAILGHNYKYEQKGNFLMVYTAEEYKQIKEDKGRMIYRIFTLHYISAAEARKMVLPILSTAGKIAASTAAETGVPTDESISATTGGGDDMALNDTIILYDYPEEITKAEKVIAAIDVRPKQVLIEATIMSITLTEGMEFGINWQTLATTGLTQPFTGVGDIARGAADFFSSTGAGVKVGTNALTGGMTVGFAHDNVAGFIRAVEAVTDVTVLANPKILAVNKQLGQVYIGNKIGYISQTTVTDAGSTSAVSFLDTGTKLSFRPYIGDDGYIRMDIHPKDSSGTITVPETTTTALPTETSAELVTNIVVKDGETIVIGGLFRDQMTTKKSQIPILGDLPLIGALFGGSADEVVRQEVVVLLTPHIIKEPSETNGYARAEDVNRKRFGAKNELHSLSRARLAEERYANAARYYLEGSLDRALHEVEMSLAVRPAYLEALRLKERIIAETQPDGTAGLDRKVLEKVERKDTRKWLRR